MEPDQLLWLQHTDLCSSCEPAGQILGYDEGKSSSKRVRREVPKVIILLFFLTSKFVSSFLIFLFFFLLRSSQSTSPASALVAYTWRPKSQRRSAT